MKTCFILLLSSLCIIRGQCQPKNPYASSVTVTENMPLWWVMGKAVPIKEDTFPYAFILDVDGDDLVVLAQDSLPAPHSLVQVQLLFHETTVIIKGRAYTLTSMLVFSYLDSNDLLPVPLNQTQYFIKQTRKHEK